MNAETKRHIDTARQILVGVVPNPTSQVDQITNALIYKFMDDMDQEAIKAGGDPSFFVGNLENYAWTRLMDTRRGNQERMNLYSEALLKFSEAKQLPELFRNIFKSAFLPYRSPEVLGLFLKEINYFNYSHTEELGDAYEHLLSIMASQGDAGQFLTPRHIIEFIVNVVNPTKDDKILDPACGTGGFLIKTYEHILKQHDGKNDPENIEKPLTPDERKTLMNNFEGYDIDPGMVRITQVNTYLHQFKNPKIYQYDTLSNDERWKDKFDVILANPPFMSPKGGIKPHNKFSIHSSRSEVLFVDYIMSHLKPNGRAGIIVPEGIIFQSGTAYKQLRKSLVEDGLYAVVSLPSGVFHPYAGVKTSILFFDNSAAKQKSELLFVKVENDGFDLGAQRRPINKNDLPQALEILKKWKTDEKVESKLAVYVEKSKIAENGDYNLSGDRYKISAEVQNEFDLVELGDLIEEQSERIKETKNIEVWSISNKDGFVLSSEYFDKQVASADISNYKTIKPGYFAYNPSRINVGSLAFNNTSKTGAVSPMYVVFSVKENVGLSADYLLNLLKSEKLNEFILQLAQGAVRQQLRVNDLKIIKIPLPPLEIQEQIVAELDDYQKIINGAEQIVNNWKPKIDIDPEWKKVKLGGVCSFEYGSAMPEKNRVAGNFPVVGSNGIVGTHKDYLVEGPTIVVGRKGSAGEVNWIKENNFPIDTTYFIKIKNKADLDLKFLYFVLLDLDLQSLRSGGAVPGLNRKDAYEKEIPFPPFTIQKQIVEQIEAERALVESTKKLIEIYSQKTQKVIAKLWEK